ncbi:MAG: hypothetical protein JWO25_3183 [Alphaproteobacteria bacterium]|nr:hypothetical protein [Alphaproteobacteria bacterium]MDB5721320.1 hypothetical protein [Alphaproteobacteria bacterium]
MRLEHYAAAAVLLALTACGSANRNEGKTDQNGQTPPSSSAAAVAGAVSRINPGQWEMTVDTAVEGLPNMPAGPATEKAVHRTCISKADAAKPPTDMFSGGQKDCVTREFNVSGGSVHSVIACGGPSASKAEITADGSFGGDSVDVRSKIVTGGQGPAMTISSHLVGHRVGECTGKEG